ncbi:MAG: hypothetical protein RLT87_02100 [Gammaproteobacteria bacterium]
MQRLTTSRGKLVVLLMMLLLLFSTAILHKVYAGKPTISLNSPVSFPVDI